MNPRIQVVTRVEKVTRSYQLNEQLRDTLDLENEALAERLYSMHRVVLLKLSTSMDYMASKMTEEVGVEPTRHFISASLVLKTRHPTRGIALPF